MSEANDSLFHSKPLVVKYNSTLSMSQHDPVGFTQAIDGCAPSFQALLASSPHGAFHMSFQVESEPRDKSTTIMQNMDVILYPT